MRSISSSVSKPRTFEQMSMIDRETSHYLFNFVERTHAAIEQEAENRRKQEQQKQIEAYRRAFEVDQGALEKAKQKFWRR